MNVMQRGALLLTAVVIASCRPAADARQSAAFDVAAMRPVIKEKNDRFTRSHITGDSAYLINIFTADARVLPPNSPAVTGKAAIVALNMEYIKSGILEFTEESTAFYGDEHYLVDEGTYLLRYGKPTTVERGKYLNIWKHDAGEWRLFSNMWNSSTPLPPNP